MRKSTLANQEIRSALIPFFDLFEHKKETASQEDWLAFVERTRERIHRAPEQFFGKYTIDASSISAVINELFDEIVQSREAFV